MALVLLVLVACSTPTPVDVSCDRLAAIGVGAHTSGHDPDAYLHGFVLAELGYNIHVTLPDIQAAMKECG